MPELRLKLTVEEDGHASAVQLLFYREKLPRQFIELYDLGVLGRGQARAFNM
jgi:hypothetical protein